MFSKIKAGLTGLSVEKFIVQVRFTLSFLIGNTNFPNPPYLPSEVESDVDTLSELQNQVKAGSRISIGPRNTLKVAIRKKMNAIAAYVNGVAMDNPAILATSGFEFVKPRIPYTIPAMITKLICKPVQPNGSVRASWKAVKERDYYVVQMRQGETGVWDEVGTCTKPNFTVPNLAFKQDVYFRVAAVNNAGMGVWSDVSMAIVV